MLNFYKKKLPFNNINKNKENNNNKNKNNNIKSSNNNNNINNNINNNNNTNNNINSTISEQQQHNFKVNNLYKNLNVQNQEIEQNKEIIPNSNQIQIQIDNQKINNINNNNNKIELQKNPNMLKIENDEKDSNNININYISEIKNSFFIENDFIKFPQPQHVLDFLKYANDTILPYQKVIKVKSFLEDDGNLMEQFHSIHNDYKNENVPLMQVYFEIVELFKDYPELIAAYINTLPKEIQQEIRFSQRYYQICVNNFINAAKVYSTRRNYKI